MEKGETNLRNQLGVDLQPDSVSVSVVQPRCFAKGGSFALGCVEKTKRMESDLDECPLIGLETLFQCRLPPIKACDSNPLSVILVLFSACAFEFQLWLVMSVSFSRCFSFMFSSNMAMRAFVLVLFQF